MAQQELRSLDAEVGRFMGLEVLGEVICFPNPEDWHFEIPIRRRERETDKHVLRPVYLNRCVCEHRNQEDSEYFGHIWLCLRIVPDYSADITAAFQVENRIAELGKQNDYIAHLWDEVGAARDGANFWTAQNFNAFWLCVHATPEQRCRAALKAVECLSISDR